MTETTVEDRGRFTVLTVHDYDALDRALAFTPKDVDKPAKPVVIKFIDNGTTRLIYPPVYHEDGRRLASAEELYRDPHTKQPERKTYTEMVAKHVIRVKPIDG